MEGPGGALTPRAVADLKKQDDIVSVAQHTGTVYVIGNDGSGIVKIGFTEDLPRRLHELATSYTPPGVNPGQLKALRILKGGRQLEMSLHAKFVQARLRRQGFTASGSASSNGRGWTEWFDLGPHALTRIDYAMQFINAEYARLAHYRG